MDHVAIQELLTAFHDGELDAPQRAKVSTHLISCRECSLILEDWSRLGKVFFRAPTAPSRAQTELAVKKVMDRIESEETHVWIPMRWLVPALGLVAASIMLAVAPTISEPVDGSEILTAAASSGAAGAAAGAILDEQ